LNHELNSTEKTTKREKEVLQLIAKAKDRKTIADKLNISINTVAVHIKKIHKKTDTSSLSELAINAFNYLDFN
jgi:DNA-binding CsgD family transcriptional regulator